MNEEIRAKVEEYHKTKSITVACDIANELYKEIHHEG